MADPFVLDAILPAGGRLSPELAAKVGVDAKALIEIGGKPLVENVLDAVAASGAVRRCVLIGGEEVRARYAARVDGFLPEAETGPDNMYNGLEYLCGRPEPPTHVLLCTTDLPFIAAEHVRRVLEIMPHDRGICVPMVGRQAFEAEYPGTASTFVTLRDGEFTLAGVFLMEVGAMRGARRHIAKVFENRKSKMGMVKLLGPGFVLKFLAKTLSVADLERKLAQMLGCTGAAVAGAPVQFAYDIDDWDDYSYAAERTPST